MPQLVIVILRGVLAVALAGSVLVEVVILPLLWIDLDEAPVGARVAFVAVAALFVAALQVAAICIWRLLTRVRRGSVFSSSSFGEVNVIIGAVSAAAVTVFVVAVLLAPGDVAPGVVGFIGAASLVLAGVALLVVVMRALLRQAIHREEEVRILRAEMDEVI